MILREVVIQFFDIESLIIHTASSLLRFRRHKTILCVSHRIFAFFSSRLRCNERMVQNRHYLYRRSILFYYIWFLFQERIDEKRPFHRIFEEICMACRKDVFSMVYHHIARFLVMYRMGTSRLLHLLKNSLSVQDVFLLWQLWHLLVPISIICLLLHHLLFLCKEKVNMAISHSNSTVYHRGYL